VKWFEIRDIRRSQNYVSAMPWAAICVSPNDRWPYLQSENRVALLQLSVDSVQNAKDIARSFLFGGMFSHNHAKQVLSFVDRYWRDVDSFLIQCNDGRTCSPAIAAAIMYIMYGNKADDWYFDNCNPNMLIYQTLIKEVTYGGFLIQ